MAITFDFPVVYWCSDDPEDNDVSYFKGSIKPIQLRHDPYEMALEARGSSFHLIFGSHVDGNFLCIPDWQFGCELTDLADSDWNLDSILHTDSLLDYEDATAIAWGLSIASKLIKQ